MEVEAGSTPEAETVLIDWTIWFLNECYAG
jgi:hypothetical protein